MTGFWLSMALAGLVLLAVAPLVVGGGWLFAAIAQQHPRRLGWFLAAFVLTAILYAGVVTAGATWLGDRWGIR